MDDIWQPKPCIVNMVNWCRKSRVGAFHFEAVDFDHSAVLSEAADLTAHGILREDWPIRLLNNLPSTDDEGQGSQVSTYHSSYPLPYHIDFAQPMNT